MSIRTEIDKLRKQINPTSNDKPAHGLAARMRARQGQPPSRIAPHPGGLAWRMQQRATRRAGLDLV